MKVRKETGEGRLRAGLVAIAAVALWAPPLSADIVFEGEAWKSAVEFNQEAGATPMRVVTTDDGVVSLVCPKDNQDKWVTYLVDVTALPAGIDRRDLHRRLRVGRHLGLVRGGSSLIGALRRPVTPGWELGMVPAMAVGRSWPTATTAEI